MPSTNETPSTKKPAGTAPIQNYLRSLESIPAARAELDKKEANASKILGEYFRKRRIACRFKLKTVAVAVKTSISRLSMMETGNYRWSFEEATAAMKLFDDADKKQPKLPAPVGDKKPAAK
jgi:hypothetical protein